MIPYSHQCIDESDREAIVRVLESEFLTQGPKVREFEEALAYYCGSKYCVTFNSATTALYASAYAIGLSKGSSFITTPISFVATANAGVYCGAIPIFVDIELNTGNLNVDLIEDNIKPDTKAIIATDYAGQPLDWKKIKELADRYDLGIIDDASHALGSEYHGERIGNCRYADVTVFSFHPVKPMTTAEGGAALTNNDKIYKTLLMFRNHGIVKEPDAFIGKPDGDWYYEMQFLSFNGRMSEIHAALGLSQLIKLDLFIEKRRKIVSWYKSYFTDTPYFDFLEEKPFAKSGYHLLSVLLKREYAEFKDKIFREIRNRGIGVQIHYIPIYKQPFYRRLGVKAFCPAADEFYFKQMSLPVYPSLTQKDFNFVCRTLSDVFNRFVE